MADPVRVLLVADSHIGFDLPVRPRVERRRRGHDFLANHAAALAPALAGSVDLVVHGGDVFHRSSVARSIAYQAYEPVLAVARRGVPVFIVPGNHEGSRLPHAALVRCANVHLFDRPRTHVVEIRGTRLALAGFPYERRDVRSGFRSILERTGWRRERAAIRLLCMHHCVEGATVGPGDFTFTGARDVIRTAELPSEFAAVLSGHIHRHQVLTRDLNGRLLATPVLYPGSVERTSFAELEETKGYMLARLSGGGAAAAVSWEFRPLPARPMVSRRVAADGRSAASVESAVRAIVAGAPPDAVVRIRVEGVGAEAALRQLSAAHLRTFVPRTMNVDVWPASGTGRERWGARSRHERAARAVSDTGAELQLDLG